MDLEERIQENNFINLLRCELIFNRIEFDKLISLLNELKNELLGQKTISKKLALLLYSIPQMTYNVYQSLDKNLDKQKDLANKTEEAWIDLDAIVIDILSS